MTYIIEEVDGEEYADEINRFNGLDPATFPALTSHHLEQGHWFFAYHNEIQEPVAFSGMVPFFEPNDGVGYMKRVYVLPDHRSNGLQLRMLYTREFRARENGWRLLVSECRPNNQASAASFRRANYAIINPDQKWANPDDLYWRKSL